MACLLTPTLAVADGLTLFKQQPRGQFGDAIAHLSQGQMTEADAILKDIIENDPSQVYALHGRAQVSIARGNLPAAERSVQSVLQSHATMPEAHNVAGVVLLLQQKNDQARREFSRAIELRPGYITPRLYLAAMARGTGNFEQARKEYQAITELAPRVGAGYIGQAEASVMAGRTEEAFATLEEWKRHAGTSVMPSQLIGTLGIVTGQPDRAIAELRAALARQPKNSVTMRLLGDAYAAKNDLPRALAEYRGALIVNPSDVEAALGLAAAQLRAGERAGAIETYRRVVAREPNQAVPANNLAWLLLEDGTDIAEAQRLAELAVMHAPTYPDGFDTLGWIHYKQGHYKVAVATLEKAKGLAPERADIAGHLGLAYARAGDKPRAIAELKRALQAKNAPNRQELDTALQSLSR
jgi:tetratricopeptide (TPR) repeat protein